MSNEKPLTIGVAIGRATIAQLDRLAARRQLATGERTTRSRVVRELIEFGLGQADAFDASSPRP